MTMSETMVAHIAPGAALHATPPAAAQHSGTCRPALPRRAPLVGLGLVVALGFAFLGLRGPGQGPWERLRCAGLPPPRRALLTQLCVSLT